MMPSRGKKGKKAKNAGPSEAVSTAQKLKGDVKTFEKRRDFLDKKAKNEFNKAKALNERNDKSTAVLHLKKKKLYDAEVKKIDHSIISLEEQIIQLESGALNLEIFEAQKLAARAQKNLLQKVDLDKLDQLQGEIADLKGDMEEINLMLTENGLDEADDEELMRELDAFDLENMEASMEGGLPVAPTKVKDPFEEEFNFNAEEENLLSQLQEAPTHVPVPVKRTGDPKMAVSDDDDEMLAALEASMV